jgi:hypothetical protein
MMMKQAAPNQCKHIW